MTTIYPTEVRAGGEWLRVEGQRMDGVVAIVGGRGAVQADPRPAGGRASGGGRAAAFARCGRRKCAIGRGTLPAEEFSFMGAGVSSERRVELVVEQIAWELHRIRERGGRWWSCRGRW